MRLLKIILTATLLFLITALVVSVYLGPDSLRFCSDPTESGDCRAADAIIVVSGGDTVARTSEAVKLYKQGYAPKIILSGAAADKTGPSNAKAMQRQAIDAGVPGADTIIEEHSATTEENAENSIAIAKDRGYQSVILVTSAYHQRRALLEFRHFGPSLDIRPHPVGEDKDWNRYWFVTPWGWNLAMSEVIKSFVATAGGVDRT